jgi:D-serine deaminase-like pyridoxal phosphate-dependent protein
MTYAVGASPAKIERIANLSRLGATVRILLENVAQARLVDDTCRSIGVDLETLIEIDCDGMRAGLHSDSKTLTALASAIAGSSNLSLEGILTHGGGSYYSKTPADIESMAEQERAAAVHAASRLRECGHRCEVVSVGSTPTAHFATNLDGVTEVRAGVYMFNDLVMVSLGVCALDDIAISVATTVIGHQEDKGWVLVDAGWMALGGSRLDGEGPPCGYGVVCRPDGVVTDDFYVISVNQEHGIVARRDGGPISTTEFPIGSLLRVLPVHACATAAMHDHYHVVDASNEVVDRWDRCRGW